jgi:hypothetical protein
VLVPVDARDTKLEEFQAALIKAVQKLSRKLARETGPPPLEPKESAEETGPTAAPRGRSEDH